MRLNRIDRCGNNPVIDAEYHMTDMHKGVGL